MKLRLCSVEGCNGKHYGKGYCNKHYQQIRKYGEIRRTKEDLNEIVLYKDYAEIILYNKESVEIARTKIDLDDIDKVKEYKWHLNDNGYVRGNVGNERMEYLHRFLLNIQGNVIIDHINGNPLDNRKCNLRIATPTQNNMNMKKRSDNISGYKGVGWQKKRNKWRARITINKKTIELGYFNTIEEAIKARQKAEEEYFGEYNRK